MIKETILEKINNPIDRTEIARLLGKGENAIYLAIHRRAKILTSLDFMRAICKVTNLTQEEILEPETVDV
jgi:hypothetical protein